MDTLSARDPRSRWYDARGIFRTAVCSQAGSNDRRGKLCNYSLASGKVCIIFDTVHLLLADKGANHMMSNSMHHEDMLTFIMHASPWQCVLTVFQSSGHAM